MDQNRDFAPQRGEEQAWGGIPAQYQQYLPLGILAGAAGLGLAIARMLEQRRQRRRSLRYRSERIMSQALEKGGYAGEYLREHGEEMAKLLEKRTRKMRKQLNRQARDANKKLQTRAGTVAERIRDQDYERLRRQTSQQLERLSAVLALYGATLAKRSQHTARNVAGRAQDLAQETPELVERVGSLAQDLTSALRESLQSTATTVGERAQTLASTAPETLRHAGELTSDRAQQLAAVIQERAATTALEARRKSRRGRLGLRTLLLGLAAGVLLSPRRGAELRAQLRQRFEQVLSGVLRPGENIEQARGQQQYDPAI